MATRTIRTPEDMAMLNLFMGDFPMPFTVTLKAGVKRSVAQNSLQRLWVTEVAQQREDITAEYARGMGKLHVGVPILRNEDEEFRVIYDEIIRPLPYESKIALMMIPIDLPVTSRMNVEQKTRYLNQMHTFWTEKGVALTDPEGRM